MSAKQLTAKAQINVSMDILATEVYKELQSAGLIKFTNPADEHPHLAMTSAEFRHHFQRAINGMELHLVID